MHPSLSDTSAFGSRARWGSRVTYMYRDTEVMVIASSDDSDIRMMMVMSAQ
jgi:hypothetical protein